MVIRPTTTGAKKGPAQLSLPVVRRLLPLLLFGALGTPVVAVEDAVHQKCLQAADYKGCVELMSGSGSGVAALKRELKLLPSRLEGTSMRDYYRSIQGFRDALSMVDYGKIQDDKGRGLYAAAQRLSGWLDLYYEIWDASTDSAIRLPDTGYNSYTMYCTDARKIISYANSRFGEKVLTYDGKPIKGIFGGNLGADSGCRRQDYKALQKILSELNKINSGRYDAISTRDDAQDYYGDLDSGDFVYKNPNAPPKGGCNKYGVCDY